MDNKKPDPHLKQPQDFSRSYLEAVTAQARLWDEAVDCLAGIENELSTISLVLRRYAEAQSLLTPEDIVQLDKKEIGDEDAPED